MRPAGSKSGFTLVEIMLALSIMLLGLVGVYAVFAVGLVSHKRAVDNTSAAVIAGSVFDDIAANYGVYYYDDDGDGRPDLGEDRNNNGIDDWFERDSAGRLRHPIPYRNGYAYEIRYERSPVVPHELFVSVHVYWQQQGRERGETFYRTVFIKGLPRRE